MDYKYIDQLLERYWNCETSLEEEDILRTFFRQDNIPAELMRYKSLFNYAEEQKTTDVLGDKFDEKILSIIEESAPVKAKIITMPQRLKPIFKAAAVVAIILTLGNAMQLPFGQEAKDPISEYDGYDLPQIEQSNPVAMGDTAAIDTTKEAWAKSKVQ